jgi:hypothetical protein
MKTKAVNITKQHPNQLISAISKNQRKIEICLAIAGLIFIVTAITTVAIYNGF